MSKTHGRKPDKKEPLRTAKEKKEAKRLKREAAKEA